MRFRIYDEPEQQNQEVKADESDGASVRENEHEREITFDTETSTDDLVDQIQDVKSDAE